MLARVLEPELMDSADEARDYDSMDHSTVNRVFASDFLSVWDTETPVLDVGTGTAQIPIELCRQCWERHPTAWNAMHIVAIDLAAHMLAVAQENEEGSIRRAPPPFRCVRGRPHAAEHAG